MASKRKPLNPLSAVSGGEGPSFKTCHLDGCGNRSRHWIKVSIGRYVPVCRSCFVSLPKELILK